MVENYYAILWRAYKMIADDLQECGLGKKIIFEMAVKAINNTAGLNHLISTFLVFGAYLCISKFDVPILTITQCVTAIINIIKNV